MAKEPQVLNVGIDLGTSRSSISASNGEKFVVESYVGWPVDMVARKVLKREVLIGHEALANRTMLDLHRPLEAGLLKEGSDKDVLAVRELLKHLMDLVTGDNGNSTIRAVVGVPAAALRTNKQHLRNALSGVVENLMIVSEPFAVAYGMEALLHSMVVDIGAGTADFVVMKGRYPTDEDQRTLTTAGDFVDEQLMKLIKQKYPDAVFTVYMVREWKEKYSFMGMPKQPVIVQAPVGGVPTDLDITVEMRQACESLVAPTVETMIDLISKVEPEYQEQVRNTIILAGGGALIPGLADALQEGLDPVGGGKVTAIKDVVYQGADGSLALAADAPDSDWERLTGT